MKHYLMPRFLFSMSTWASIGSEQIEQTKRFVVSL